MARPWTRFSLLGAAMALHQTPIEFKIIVWLFDKSMLEAKLVPGASEFVELDGQLAVVLGTAGAIT